MRPFTLPVLAIAALAACEGGSPSADDAELPMDASTASPSEMPSAVPAATASPGANEIPVAIRGRWGLDPADCEPGPNDATGLLTITADKLEFYESVGALDGIEEFDAHRIRASFDFTGEAMSWERDIVLDVQDGGAALVRREYGADAAPGPIRYTKCN